MRQHIIYILFSVHIKSGLSVAIKVINLESDDEAEGIEEVRKEISILSHCSSEYITRYHGSFVQGTKLWIVMDYCGLGSLRNIVYKAFVFYFYFRMILLIVNIWRIDPRRNINSFS